MEKLPPCRTPLMEMFLDAAREQLQEAMREGKRRGYRRESQAAAIAFIRMIEASLDLSLVVSGDGYQSNTQTKTTIMPVPTWIEPSKPIRLTAAPFLVAAVSLTCSGDPDAIQAVLRDAPPLVQKALESLPQFADRDLWRVDAIDAAGEIVFGMVYEQDHGWRSCQEMNLCPWHQCHKQQATFVECARCKVLRESMKSYVCAVLTREGIENARSIKALGGLKSASSSVTATPVGDSLVELLLHEEAPALAAIRRLQASGLPAFLNAYKVQERRRIQDLRLHSVNPFESRTAQLLLAFQIEALKSSKVILIPEHVQEIIEQKIAEHGGVDGPRLPAILPQESRNLWIKLAHPLSIDQGTWKASAFFFSQSNDPRIIERVMPLFEHDAQIREAAQMLRGEPREYAIDVIDTMDNKVKFTVTYQLGKRVMPSGNAHQCHSHTPGCGQHGWICPPCQKVLELIRGYFSMALLARCGEFAEVVIMEETERVKRGQPRLQSKKEAKKKHRQTIWEGRTLSTRVVNVSQKVMIEEDAGEGKRSGHPNWIKVHESEEIESYKAVQPAYTRNGKRIIPQVPRKWYKLKKTTSVEEMR